MKSDLRNPSDPSVSVSPQASNPLSNAHVSPDEGHALASALRAAAYIECSSKDDMESVHTGFQMLSWLALGYREGARTGRGGRRRQRLKMGCVVI